LHLYLGRGCILTAFIKLAQRLGFSRREILGLEHIAVLKGAAMLWAIVKSWSPHRRGICSSPRGDCAERGDLWRDLRGARRLV